MFSALAYESGRGKGEGTLTSISQRERKSECTNWLQDISFRR
jgi:hypothetical protein